MATTVDNTAALEAAASSIPPFPFPRADWSHDNPTHSGFLVHGLEDTPGNKSYFIQMEAKPGKEEALAKFLQDIHDGIDKEPLTGPWFGLRYSKTVFCIFQAFPSAQGRHDHDNGPGGQNFFQRPEDLKEMLAIRRSCIAWMSCMGS